jgi:hypothetical protein
VSPSCVGQLRAVAAGRGEAHYTITFPKGVPHRSISPVSTRSRMHHDDPTFCPHASPPSALVVGMRPQGTSFRYSARLSDDGFVIQRNLETGAERPLRPAPWLGLSRNVSEEQRVDPTNGHVPGEMEVPPERREGRRRAEEFYEPEVVSLGTEEQPVALVEAPPEEPPPAPVEQPSVPAQPMFPFMQPAQPVIPQAQPVIPQAQPVIPQAQPVIPQATPVFYYQPQVEQANPAPNASDSDPNAAGLAAASAAKAAASQSPKAPSMFSQVKGFLFKDEVAEALKAELKLALDLKVKDEALKKKISIAELLRDTQMQIDCGVNKPKAIERSLEAAIYIAKNTK